MSHVLIPQINKIDAVHTLEGSNGNGNGKEPSPTMQIAVKGLRLFDTLASIFSTIWLIVGKYFDKQLIKMQVLLLLAWFMETLSWWVKELKITCKKNEGPFS